MKKNCIFFSKKFVISKKSSTFALAVPVIPLPDIDADEESGFFIFMAKSELDILTFPSGSNLLGLILLNLSARQSCYRSWLDECRYAEMACAN